MTEPFVDRCGQNHVNIKGYYDRETCLQICTQLLRNETCGCGDPRVPLPDDVAPCLLNETTNVCCLEEVRAHLSSGKKKCDCPLSCLENTFKMTVSMSSIDRMKNAVSSSSDKSTINIIKVYFRTKETVIYSSTPKYQTQDILSSVGGQIGLWLGISIISTFQTIMHLTRRVSNRYKNRKSPVTTIAASPGRNKSTWDDTGN
ncbi:degenerin deg-1-like isoform X2 [Limulus polyphemus]|uniref:Degenerin deg-1-like isoform X2 n=1 Tax=Limulus polyphemus TaxID=6850 RepID=A0ABM1TQ22_LIMPO|nr:degenerin deg-1-like isoform X2 [Limulus polyphemus]